MFSRILDSLRPRDPRLNYRESEQHNEYTGKTGGCEDGLDAIYVELHDTIMRNDVPNCKRLVVTKEIDLNKELKICQKVSSWESRLVSRDVMCLPLHVSCIYKRPQIVKLLLELGADPNLTDHLGRIPTQLVLLYWPRIPIASDTAELSPEETKYQSYLESQHKKALTSLKHLCHHGADVTIVTNTKETLLHLVAKYNLHMGVDTLLQYGGELEARDTAGNTPLLLAARLGNYVTTKKLVECGSDVGQVDLENKTVLHLLPDNTQNATHVTFLLQNGADPNSRDNCGQTPLHKAVLHSEENIIEALLNHGANADITDSVGHGYTALAWFVDNPQNVKRVYGLQLLLQNTLYIGNLLDVYPESDPDVRGQDAQRSEWQELKHRITEASRQVPALQRICKVTVRRHLDWRRTRQEAVNELPCPPGIKNIIRYNTVQWRHNTRGT